jgi:phage I-like protein
MNQDGTNDGAEREEKGDARKDIMDKMAGLTRSLRSQTVVGQLTSSQTVGASDALPAWSSLNATQQEAARVLGFSAKTWSRITAAVTTELQGVP